MLLAEGVVRLLTRLEVTGDIPEQARRGSLILAANHISPFDPIAVAAAFRRLGVHPRIMANAGLFRTPVIGPLMRWQGHIQVDRGEPTAGNAVTDSVTALDEGAMLMIYPEGRIGLDPAMWPERGRTGVGRLVLATGAPVIPVAIWGSHEVIPYAAPTGMWPMIWRSLRRRPRVRVHVGPRVDLSGIEEARPGAAQRIADRIIDAIAIELAPLRADEPDAPRFVDPSRPTETRRARPRTAR
ncbi:lysophospholipid acyltransferase family protein [Catellatospora sichuanensis]|uniref:lysophospholipid acyltransferase family protein n=1 Tax=Catellatospora sichuanensis TaxID=1969805 RepID=UPI00118209CA|nr:lysophospholipid acyltransferase family protein [Catellatospora sichuanensis]